MDFLPGRSSHAHPTTPKTQGAEASLTRIQENLQTLLQYPSVTFLRTSTQEHLTSQLSHLRATYVQPYLIQPLSAFLTSSAMPDLLSIFLLVIILFISLKVLDYARRVIMFWVSLAFRLVFWGSVIGIAWYVYRVGVENASRDFGWLWGVLEGFFQDFQARGVAAANVNSNAGGSRAGWGPGSGSRRKGY